MEQGPRPGGLALLHARYAQWLGERLRRRFGTEAAEDLMQETWARLAARPEAASPLHPKAFLLRVAINLAMDGHRRDAGRARLDALRPPLATSQPPEQYDRLLLEEIVLSLPEPLRDVFVLSRFVSLDNAEIGRRLGLSPRTVEWRLTRALAHCAEQLRREDQGPP